MAGFSFSQLLAAVPAVATASTLILVAPPMLADSSGVHPVLYVPTTLPIANYGFLSG